MRSQGYMCRTRARGGPGDEEDSIRGLVKFESFAWFEKLHNVRGE